MKKIKKSSELLWLLGIITAALGVAICGKANLGVSMIAAPGFIINEALTKVFPGMTVGMTEYIFQGILLIVLCIIIRRFNWRYLLAFLVAVLYGYTLNFFLFVLGGITFDEVWLRWIMLLLGDCIIAFGIACFFRTYLPLQVHELTVSEISLRFKININKVKSVFDISLLLLSLVLALTLFGDVGDFDFSTIGYSSFHNIGLGTLLTTFINSPLIMLMGKLVNKLFEPTPMFPKLEAILKRN